VPPQGGKSEFADLSLLCFFPLGGLRGWLRLARSEVFDPDFQVGSGHFDIAPPGVLLIEKRTDLGRKRYDHREGWIEEYCVSSDSRSAGDSAKMSSFQVEVERLRVANVSGHLRANREEQGKRSILPDRLQSTRLAVKPRWLGCAA